jgi:transposase
MNPVIGLDVAKGESQGQAFLDKGKPHGKSVRIVHTRDGLDAFHLFLQEIEALSKQQPTVILESTGHYHALIVQFLEQHHYAYIMVNPLISHQAKKSSLRKVKTDAVDAYCLAELFYKEEFDTHKKRGLQLLNLRNLTRQHAAISGLFVQTKLQFLAILDQVFPEYRGVFGDLYSHVSLEILQAFPTSTQVLALDEEVLADKISSLCKSRSPGWARERAQRIREAALRNPFTHTRFESHLFSMDMYIRMILEYKEHLSALEKQIDALAQGIEEYQMIQSIPGIGGKIAATILSEIGEIDRFHHPKKLVAFAGVDPSVHSSGKFTATVNHITKRGSSRLRHTLYVAVLCGIRSSGSKKLRAYYNQKRDEGKAFKVAIIACVNKLVHWIYAVLKRKEAFVDVV